MQTQLRETADELAGVLWREHTVYRERGGGVVIRGEHVRRWISMAPTGGRDQALIRAGRILDGGTSAPARLEVVVDLTAGTAELAAVCRRLLAETAAGTEAPAPAPPRPGRQRAPRAKRAGRAPKGRRMSLASWVVLLTVTGIVALWAYSVLAGPAGR
ncbi:hypothetical protein GTW43_19975 [Streptomyces sp. SID5785]|uniref:hypothetical protein n=1 Tax=Streptomyces sp. SID5785 TaxID=2690309 RepID=UPI001361DA32|nr:hypothetical protein [Streptomyces sp. SID5785]MZD07341.1 hypothetical protein [Streptomyces sp. SID5785]